MSSFLADVDTPPQNVGPSPEGRPRTLFSKRAPFDSNVHPELRRLANLLQTELGRHEQQLAKIQYDERKQAIERAFRAVTPLKNLDYLGSPDSFKASPNQSDHRSPLQHERGLDLSTSGGGMELDVDGGLNLSTRSSLGASLRSSTAESGTRFESVFLGAALELLEKESEFRRTNVGMSKTDVQQLIKTGHLMKGKGDPTSGGKGKIRFVKKKVTVTAGKFTYFPLRSQKDSAITWLKGGKSADDDTPADGTTIDYGVRKYLVFPFDAPKRVDQDKCFIIYDVDKKDESRVWMASDAVERQRWMTSIRTAIRIANSTATSTRDIEVCGALRNEIVGADYGEEYKRILKKWVGGGRGLCVPISWVHKEMQKIDKGHLAAIENDMTIEQMKKDMLRDTFHIGGNLIHGVNGVESVVGTLATLILGQGDAGNKLTQAQAVRFAREVLYECSRSQFGGDCYYTARYLCLSEAMDLIITPEHSVHPLPIIFKVKHEPYMEDSNISLSAKADLLKLLGARYDEAVRESIANEGSLLTVHMESAMVFEVNDMDLSDEGKLARVRTTFKRSFVFAGEYPVALGAGNVFMELL
jgi:hypothetical protein